GAVVAVRRMCAPATARRRSPQVVDCRPGCWSRAAVAARQPGTRAANRLAVAAAGGAGVGRGSGGVEDGGGGGAAGGGGGARGGPERGGGGGGRGPPLAWRRGSFWVRRGLADPGRGRRRWTGRSWRYRTGR